MWNFQAQCLTFLTSVLLAKPATQSQTSLVRLNSVMQVASVKQPKNGLGANPESWVIKYE
jgi:hypothetical protein